MQSGEELQAIKIEKIKGKKNGNKISLRYSVPSAL